MAASPGNASTEYVKFIIKDKKYIPTLATQKLLDDIGGTQALQTMTTLFYQEMFKNPHMEKFFMKTKVMLHANRLAFWSKTVSPSLLWGLKQRGPQKDAKTSPNALKGI